MTGGDSSRRQPRHTSQASPSPGRSTRPPETGAGGPPARTASRPTIGDRSGGSHPATAFSLTSRRASPGRHAVRYSHSSAPTAVRNRGGVGSSGPGPIVPPEDDDGSGDDDGTCGVSRAAVDRDRLRRLLNGAAAGAPPAPVASAPADRPVGLTGAEDGSVWGYLEAGRHPGTEQDSSCEVAAQGIILVCRESGVCDVALRGITRLPPSLVSFFKAEGGLVSELHLQGNRLTAVPPLELLPALTQLDLSTNLLSSLPATLGQLRRLRCLDVSRNHHLACLPDALCDLTALTSLDLSHNALECLPLRMERLARLVELRLDCNQLSYLPPSCAGLPSLTALHVSHNRLTALPAELGSARSLTGVFAGHNLLTALPATIGQLRQRLAELQLHNNHLSVLPREVGLLAALTRLTSSSNPLVHPPLEVARQGVAAVREYLRGGWRGALHEEADEEAGAASGNPPGVGDEDGGGGGANADQKQDQVLRPAAEGEGGGNPPHASLSPQRLSLAAAPGREGGQLVLGAACKACVDKDDHIEELNQLLHEARERLERCERQLEFSREQISRQARDLAATASRAVEAEAERGRLARQLEAAALLPGFRGPAGGRGAGGAGGGKGGGGDREGAGRGAAASRGAAGGDRSQEQVEEHLRAEVRAAMGRAEVAEAAAEAAAREVKQLRRAAEEGESKFRAERERAEDLAAGLARERERCIAATEAATEASHRFTELQPLVVQVAELRRKLEAADKATQDAWKAADVAREGHLSSDAASDMAQGRLVAMEAAHTRLSQELQQERRAAAAAAVEAESRQRQLQVEVVRLQADLAALLAEREVLGDVAVRGREGAAGTAAAGGGSGTAGQPTSVRPSWGAWTEPQFI